ncbi:hypothetical protein GIB67_019056 [Kingdonia uniflora]|uniref:Inhibitor I9 domain-containing protein n=1 Tax=Kingdonia uniflora TaxID=39325 RepID=A0A7J7MZL9_9MAGN|nr:hypothetical protein GIB67_019056 [Kingdonia uniflora]
MGKSNMVALFFLFFNNFPTTLVTDPVMSTSDHSSHIGTTPLSDDLQTYIIHVNQPEFTISAESQDREMWHRSFLAFTIASSSDRMIYSYNHVVSGFAAKLTAKEVKAMEEKDGFVSARPDRISRRQTTYTPTPRFGLLEGVQLR